MINRVRLLSTYGFFFLPGFDQMNLMDFHHLFKIKKREITSLFVTPQIYTRKGMQTTKLV
jgi:hypothetical protein